MGERNWDLIQSGATFESLATTLIFFEDSRAALFGRRGKDGGQDARSGDGTLVFQAKHHRNASAAAAIRDAKAEAEKIKKYRTKGHTRYEQWKSVTHWRLVSNAKFNPTDRETWDNEVVPLFRELGLEPDFWLCSTLDALLDKHPYVARAYFERETRTFLSLPEVRERLPEREPFLRRDGLGEFAGREAECDSIAQFLGDDELFIVISGAGGVGKTRLLLEAGQQASETGSWQVLWANVESMSATATWFEAIAPERPTLLLVDEPETEQLLRLLVEQLGGRAAKWKVAVSVRSPKDPVLRFLAGPRIQQRVRSLEVASLPQADATTMCRNLLDTGKLAESPERWREEAASELAERFTRHPIWLTLAVHLLEERGNLAAVPRTAEALADAYLEEILGHQTTYPRDNLLVLLRWIALLGTVKRTDHNAITLLARRSGIGGPVATEAALARLVERRALRAWGAERRLLEIVPDVLRDHLLLTWLAVDIGHGENPMRPSDDAGSLVSEVCDHILGQELDSLYGSILVSLAQAERLLFLSGRPVALLDPLFGRIDAELSSLGAAQRLVVIESVKSIAPFRPAEAVAVSRRMRESVVATEVIKGIISTRSVGQDEVVLALGWMVGHAALGAETIEARTAVIQELCALAEAEAELEIRNGSLPNDGRRGFSQLSNTIAGGPQYWSSFDDVAGTHAHSLLEELARSEPSPARAWLLDKLLASLLSLERRQSWSSDHAFHWRMVTIKPGHPAWEIRSSLLQRIRELLADEATPVGSRIVLWKLFEPTRPKEDKLESFRWARDVLQGRTDNLDELVAARSLWHWEIQYGSDPDLKAAAQELEALYRSHSLAAEFEPIVSDWKGDLRLAEAKAAELAAETAPAICSFIDRALEFLGSEDEFRRMFAIAFELGKRAAGCDGVGEFVRTALSQPSRSAHTDFAMDVVASWLMTLRAGEDPSAAPTLVAELAKTERGLDLLERLYGQSPHPAGLSYHEDEFELVRAARPEFMKAGRGPAFLASIAWTVGYEWPSLKKLIEETLDSLPEEQLTAGVMATLDGVYSHVRANESGPHPPELGTWLLDQILRVPDLDAGSARFDWELGEILKASGRPPLSWLPEALDHRRRMEQQHDYGELQAVGMSHQLADWVTPITPDDVAKPEITASVAALVDFATDERSIGYYIDKILQAVDPKGLMVPAEVVRRLDGPIEYSKLRRLARVAKAYPVNSEMWRVIARPFLERAPNLERSERSDLFNILDERITSWSGRPGEVPPVFVAAVEKAKDRLETEADPVFRPLWERELKVAEADLKSQEEEAKEERGE